MYIKLRQGVKVNIIQAKKVAFKKTSYYQICSDNKNQKDNQMGKLKAVDGVKNLYVLYDSG